MPSLPISTAFTDSAVTEAGFKTAITNQREFLAGLLDTSGNQIDALRKLGVLGSDTSAKSGAYTVVAADRGVTFLCTGTFTLTLTAAATLGDGFTFAVINIGTGTITIDPNSTELIDGASTDSIAAGSWAIVTCTGSAFHTMGAVPATGALIGYRVFTASGTYTKATNNPSFVIVEVVGGGGGGGEAPASSFAGGGGGGGYSRKMILASAIAASETVTVGLGGNGGTANNAGSNGGTSSFGSHCSATGGRGGGITIGTGGVGGSGSGGNLNLQGDGGHCTTNAAGNNGGGSIFGGGASGKPTGAGSGQANNGGTNTGGGGASGYIQNAGNGGSGIVIVWEYA